MLPGIIEQAELATLDDSSNLLRFPARAMIDCTRFYKVIRPNLVASALVSHLVCSQFAIFGVLLGTMKVIDLSGQDPEGLPTVRMLIPAVNEHMEAGRNVTHTNC